MIEYRRLLRDETDAAARLHQTSALLMPGFDPGSRSSEQTLALYREAFGRGPIWGAYDRGSLVGVLVLEPAWIEHLYVEPSRSGEGIGRALVQLAQAEQDDLQLFTWQSNTRARRLNEATGFIAAEFGVDETSPNRPGNVRYRWRRPMA